MHVDVFVCESFCLSVFVCVSVNVNVSVSVSVNHREGKCNRRNTMSVRVGVSECDSSRGKVQQKGCQLVRHNRRRHCISAVLLLLKTQVQLLQCRHVLLQRK